MRGAFPHVGCSYQSRFEFLSGAAQYIADGVSRNQRIVYVGDRSRDALRAELTGIALGDGLKKGAISAVPAEDYFVFKSGTDTVDPEPAMARYVAAADEAIMQGYNGFRAVVDVTPVARTPEQREALAGLEYLVDQKMTMLPFSAMCAYDASELGKAAAELICLHPFVDSPAPPFRLHADPHGVADFVLAGEIDAYSHGLFATALQRVWPYIVSDPLRIDACALEFIGHEQLYMLDDNARRRNRHVVLCSDQRILRRLAELVDLTNVSVTSAPSGRRPQRETDSAIDHVKALLMENFGLGNHDAFALLAQFARITKTPVAERAERIREDLADGAPDERGLATLDALKTIHDEMRCFRD